MRAIPCAQNQESKKEEAKCRQGRKNWAPAGSELVDPESYNRELYPHADEFVRGQIQLNMSGECIERLCIRCLGIVESLQSAKCQHVVLLQEKLKPCEQDLILTRRFISKVHRSLM
jgi:hypothetical protein